MAYKNKEEQKKAWREHYSRNKEYYAERNKNRKRNHRDWLASLKEGKPCSMCGNSYHPKAMDWHHRDVSTKEFNVAESVNLGYGKERVLKEIEKCDLVCAVCHRLI